MRSRLLFSGVFPEYKGPKNVLTAKKREEFPVLTCILSIFRKKYSTFTIFLIGILHFPFCTAPVSRAESPNFKPYGTNYPVFFVVETRVGKIAPSFFVEKSNSSKSFLCKSGISALLCILTIWPPETLSNIYQCFSFSLLQPDEKAGILDAVGNG